MENNDVIMTCKVGRFSFDRGVLLSHAKLVRDSIMAQILNPKPQFGKIKDEQSAREFVQNHCAGSFAHVPFSFAMNNKKGSN